MSTINGMANLDTQGLPKQERERIITSCRSFLRRAEASAALSDALAVEQPDFTGFDHFPLLRLRNLFSALVGDSLDRNLASLRELDIPTMVTLGLCLSTTKIKRMDKDDLEEVIHQAKEIGSRIRSTIYTNNPLAQAIQGSSNPGLIQEFNQQVGKLISSLTENHHVVWGNAIAYAETAPHGHKFQGLTALALHRVVTVYLPLETDDDCGIRLTALFSEALLINLFGYRPDIYGDRAELHALKHQIAPTLGEDVLKSVQATTTWEGISEVRTTCVKAMVYAGHSIVIDVLVTRHDAIELINRGAPHVITAASPHRSC